jgi:predicted CXXCH cytochrome family protein
MKSMLRTLLVLAGVVALSALAIAVAYAGPGDVVNTKHNLGSPGNSACQACHVPHDAQGDFLWARSVGSGTGLRSLCYSCHDGSVTNKGAYAFDTSKVQHKVTPGVKGQDCDRCHDPHANSFKFTTLGQPNADVCSTCHGKTGANNHPVDIAASSYPPSDATWDANAGDLSGTRLYDSTGTTLVTNGTGYLKCLSCHAPHGSNAGKLNTMPKSSSTDSSSPLCQNCHN